MKTEFHAIFLGAGPAGTGPLMSAMRRGDLDAFLARGILWIDERDEMVGGSIGENLIPSDTAASVLLECLEGPHAAPLASLAAQAVTEELRRHGTGPLPLPLAGRYLDALGTAIRQVVQTSGPSCFLGRTRATAVEETADGFVVHTQSPDRGAQAFHARHVVFAMGGQQSRLDLLASPIAAGSTLGEPQFADRVFTSSEIFSAAGQPRFFGALRARDAPRLVILGGSHSAMTAAWLALNHADVRFADGAVKVLCRRLPKVFYPNRDAARSDGYLDWDERDVCPVTGRVFRLGGLRLNARETFRSARGIGDAAADPRLTVETFDPTRDESSLRETLSRADVIVAAFGYRPRVVPITGAGSRRRLRSEGQGVAPLVDDRCRLVTQEGEVIARAYGMGLASGFVPSGPLGGEPSFRGQTNGIWLYQNGVGEIVLDALLADAVRTSSAAAAGAIHARLAPKPGVNVFDAVRAGSVEPRYSGT